MNCIGSEPPMPPRGWQISRAELVTWAREVVSPENPEDAQWHADNVACWIRNLTYISRMP